MKRMFKNSILKNTILILIMLFSLNNVVLAKERRFPDGELVDKEALEKIKDSIDIARLRIHNNKKRNVFEQANINMLKEINQPPKGNKYMKLAFSDLEVRNRARYKEAESRKLMETQDYLNKDLADILTLEQELNIKVEHHPEVQNAINKNDFFKQIVSKK